MGRRIRPWLLTLLAAGLAFAGGHWLWEHWGLEETDNAQLQAHLVDISSRMPGSIMAIPVQDNQAVRAGQFLVLLDPRDALVQVRRQEADLQEALRQGGVSRQEVDRARASFRQAQVQLTRSQASALQARGSERQVGVDRDRAAAAETRSAGWRGRVVSVAPASGSRFALLPPDNATGNFTKLVQLVSVRIVLEEVPPTLAPRLVPGLSARVRVRRR
jgi:multidrug resistance efflux pump